MRILYHHRIASKDGQYVHIESIIKEMRKQGHEVFVVAPSVAENSEFGSSGGWVSKLRSLIPSGVSELLEFCYSFFVFFKLLVAIKKYKPDVIYERYNLFLPAGIWVKKLFKLPMQLEVNSPLYNERKEYGGLTLSWLAKWSEHYTWKNSDRVLPVTHVLAQYIVAAGVDKSKVEVIPNGVDSTMFAPQQLSCRSKVFDNKLVVGFVGFCREWHQLDAVLERLARMKNPNIHFLLVGDGPVIESLNSQAESLGFTSAFTATGLVSRDEIPYWLDQIDIALQPAVTPWASPLKMIEYLAKGLAIVAPNSPNIKELLVHNSNALLFEEGNKEQMVAQIESLIVDTELRKKLQKEASKTILLKKLTWENNTRAILHWFDNELIKRAS